MAPRFLRWIILIAAVLWTGLAFYNALGIAGLGAMVFYDYNFEVMHNVLSREHASQLCASAQSLLRSVTIPLAISNIVWIILYFSPRARKHNSAEIDQPNRVPVTDR